MKVRTLGIARERAWRRRLTKRTYTRPEHQKAPTASIYSFGFFPCCSVRCGPPPTSNRSITSTLMRDVIGELREADMEVYKVAEPWSRRPRATFNHTNRGPFAFFFSSLLAVRGVELTFAFVAFLASPTRASRTETHSRTCTSNFASKTCCATDHMNGRTSRIDVSAKLLTPLDFNAHAGDGRGHRCKRPHALYKLTSILPGAKQDCSRGEAKRDATTGGRGNQAPNDLCLPMKPRKYEFHVPLEQVSSDEARAISSFKDEKQRLWLTTNEHAFRGCVS